MNGGVAIVGAGAVAGLLADWLAAAGHARPLVCARRPLESFTILRPGEDPVVVPVRSALDPGEVETHRWVLVAVKAQDSSSTRPWLDALVGPGTTVVVLQNGIDHESRFRGLTSAPIVPALVYAGAERTAPGTVRHHLGGLLVVRDDEHGQSFARLLEGGVPVATSTDFVTDSWRKLLLNLGLNPVTALTLRRTDVLREPQVAQLCSSLLDEAAEVARACGARITDDDVADVLELYASYPQGTGSSMLEDRLSGRPLEAEAIVGAVVAAARAFGLSAPIAQTLFALTSEAAPVPSAPVEATGEPA